MENSPQPIKRNSRLSLGSKHRLSDSPKTPIRNKKLICNDGYETPPSIKINSDNYFGEESPSQDYDYSFIPMSQDIQPYRDVTWKFNDENDSQQSKSKKKEFRPAIIKKIENSSSILNNQNKVDKTKGFYKFQELLSAEGGNLKRLLNKNCKKNVEKIKNSENNICDSNNETLESSFKENIDSFYLESCVTKVEKKATNNITNKVYSKQLGSMVQLKDSGTKSEINQNDIHLLDDSDSDNLLFELTQKLDNNIQNTKSSTNTVSEGSLFVNVGKTKTNLSHIKNTNLDNDSIDELLLSLPMDEPINTNTNKYPKTYCDIKSAFSRHNSMPPRKSPNSANILLRYSSANCIRTQSKISPKSLNGDGQISPFSDGSIESVNSIVSDHLSLSRKCTKAEVEKKRQEAKLRRIQSQMRKELTQKKS